MTASVYTPWTWISGVDARYSCLSGVQKIRRDKYWRKQADLELQICESESYERARKGMIERLCMEDNSEMDW
jgi:hypothetical protein